MSETLLLRAQERFYDSYLCIFPVLWSVQLFATAWTVAHQAPLSMGFLQSRILEWVAVPSPRGSFQPRDRTQVSHIEGGFFPVSATREAQEYCNGQPVPSPGDLPNPEIQLWSPAWQADSLPAELPGKPGGFIGLPYTFLFFFKKFIYLGFSCGMQGLVPLPGIEPVSPDWEHRVLAIGLPGKSFPIHFFVISCESIISI